MSEARAFAAGYKAAIDVLEDVYEHMKKKAAPGAAGVGTAIIALELGATQFVANSFEMWQLNQDPDFQESVAQMQRGEGREIDPAEFKGA